MNILKNVVGKIKSFRNLRYILKKTNELSNKIKSEHIKSRIYYFCTPTHSNIGDQAQYFCWLKLLTEWYPEYEIISVPFQYSTPTTIQLIKNFIEPEDRIYIHSGYLIFDLHPQLHFLCNVIDSFHDKAVTIFPQTINLVNDRMKKYVSECFNSHPNLTVICRDEVSYANAQTFFQNCKLKLMPDVVTSLIGCEDFYYENKRNGVLFCVRNDIEKYYSDKEIDDLRLKFSKTKTDICDTTIKAPIWEWENEREKIIRSILKKFSQYQVIITDRYHGTIFSQIENTPVIVLSSTDHKLSSGVKWFPKEVFADNFHYANNLDEAYEIAKKILNNNGLETKNPPFFKTAFFYELL